jgi:hypothetical protein
MSTQPEDDDREPIEVLYDIEAAVNGETGQSDRGDLPKEPRKVPRRGSALQRVLHYLSRNGASSNDELSDNVEGNVTRAASNGYFAYLLDRKRPESTYLYEINEVGEEALRRSEEVSEARNPEVEQDTLAPDPWEKADIAKGNFIALRCVADAEDAPRSTDIDERFRDETDAPGDTNGPAVSPYLTNLFDDGLVDRTPTRPYRYWLTEDGKEILSDAE